MRKVVIDGECLVAFTEGEITEFSNNFSAMKSALEEYEELFNSEVEV